MSSAFAPSRAASEARAEITQLRAGVPGLPFTNDSHIPVDDPRAVEAIGRRHCGKTWPGPPRNQNGWVTYTTDPGRGDLAWIVRYHPEHGRSVLYRDADAVSGHSDYTDGPLLFRAGGYWWDGGTWYRPAQVVDHPGEDYYHRPFPAPVTAAGILADPAEITGIAASTLRAYPRSPATSSAQSPARPSASSASPRNRADCPGRHRHGRRLP